MKRVKRSRWAWLGVVLSCAVFLLASSATLGQITSGGEIQVAGSATFQAFPAVASDAAGNVYVAVWQKQVAGGWEVFGRRYALSGGALVPGAEFQVNTVTAGCQMLPVVAADFNGNFVVVWQSDQDPGGGTGVYARRYNSAGAALDGVEFRVNTTAAGNQARPSVAVAPDGRFLVAWQSDQQTGGQGWDVAAQAYNASGSVAGSEVLINSATAGSQTLPRAAYLSAPTEGFAVAWESVGAIFVRRVLMSGAALDASDRQVNTTATGFHRSPAVASDPSGNYTVVWEGWDADGLTSRILGQRFHGVSPLNPSSDLTIDATAGATQQRNPAVAHDSMANWLVTWDSVGEDASGAALVAQQLDNLQTLTGAKAVLNETITAGDQTLPGVVMTQGSRLLVAWQSLTPAADGAVIEARPGNLPGNNFYTLQPCRLLDTRNPSGELGGPALTSGTKRVFKVVSASNCGIPLTAKALSVNVTAVGAVATGSVNLFPGDGPSVGTVVVSFTATRSTIADNAHVLLSRDGSGSVAALASITGGGQVHLIMDVNGYYQ